MLNPSSTEQLPQSADLATSSSQAVNRSTRFGIKSTNVILEEYYEPTEAIILIENEKIVDVVIPSETEPEALAQLLNGWDITDYGSQYVFPGLVDSNVHLHSDFDDEWENISYCTEAAAAGGVTTIVDNPIMSKPFTNGTEYVASLQKRIDNLKSKSKVDFGIFAALDPKTQDSVDDIIEAGAMGLKCYLLNCMQNTVGNFSSENFPHLMKSLQKYQDLLLVVHPEIATERELYLTSPCRIDSLEKRLELKHALKSVEFGGAANKGSYLDEICKKSGTQEEEEDDDDDDCPTATLDTPSKLRSKVKRTKEKTEINDIVHFELLSYNYDDDEKKKENNDDDDGSSSDSDVEEIKQAKKKPQADEGDKANIVKKSLFNKSFRSNNTVEVIPEEGDGESVQQVAAPELKPRPLLFQRIADKGSKSPKKIQLGAAPQTKSKATEARKMLSFFTACDVKETLEKQSVPPTTNAKPVVSLASLENKELANTDPKSTPTTTDTIEPANSPSFGDSSQEDKAKNNSLVSPALSSTSMTPASSSLLQRRLLCRKTTNPINISATTLSSPSSDFTKVNSLEVLKSPRTLAQKEAKFNQSYRIFLANRPQNWEENAVSLVLACIKPDTSLRVMLPNLSVASSLLKIRQKKKSNDAYLQRIFSDASASHLFFNEKMVKKGDTKFKVSPPFRNKENRHLLVENFRLGGIDTLSSYHFYVPQRFKQIDDGNFRRAFGGLESMGCSLQGAWTAVYSHQQKTNKKFTEDLLYQKKTINHILRQIYKSMCYNPAQMLKIGERKGSIAKGKDADIVLWDPFKVASNDELTVTHVFAGKSLLGVVNQTYLRGNLIYNKENNREQQTIRDYKPEFIRP